MRRLLSLALLLAILSGVGFAANKEQGTTTLKDVQPAGTTDKQHKKQQYDLSFLTAKNDYTCRTNENEKVNATDWVVGSSINFKINGNKGEIKNTQSGKNVKCMVVRVAAAAGTAPTQ
jgi:hypothetical protein